ncbi:MAG: hypothetical protein Q9227_006237 [Pyrenula ochraceoflavens]
MPKWLSFYQTMQAAKSKSVLVHDVSPVDNLAVALFLGDAEFKLYAGIITLDNNRVRFAVRDWQTMIALKILRSKIQALISYAMQQQGRKALPLSESLQKWADIWQRVMQAWDEKARKRGGISSA